MIVTVWLTTAIVVLVCAVHASSFHSLPRFPVFKRYTLTAIARRTDTKKVKRDKLGEHTLSSIKKAYKRKIQSVEVVPKVWRVSSVNVPLAMDPGKDDLTVHDALIRSVSTFIDVPVKRLSNCDIVIVKKSYDGRRKKSCPPGFTYVVDITAGPGPALKITAKAGKVERKDGDVDVNVIATKLLTYASVLSRATHSDQPGSTPPKVVIVGAGPAGT